MSIFWSWLALLVLSVWLPWLLGLAVSVHVTAIADLYFGAAALTCWSRDSLLARAFLALWCSCTGRRGPRW